MIDYKYEEVDLELIKSLLEFNRVSFPGFLKKIYILDLDLKKIYSDESKRATLKNLKNDHPIFILPPKFTGPLFKDI